MNHHSWQEKILKHPKVIPTWEVEMTGFQFKASWGKKVRSYLKKQAECGGTL
jgi:hypothetical protein